MRDSHKDINYFKEQIEDFKSFISEDKETKLNEENYKTINIPLEVYIKNVNYSMFLDTLNLLKCQYSLGESISVIKQTYIEAIELMNKGWDKKEEDFNGFYTVDDYWKILTMLSLGYLLNIEQEKMQDLIKLRFIINKPDFLLDSICNSIVGSPIVIDKNYMKEGNNYIVLYDILHAPNKEESIKLLYKYVKSDWYKKTQANSWHGTHDKHSYNGYWSFESAAIVKMLGLDDSSFKGLKYYPYDLLHSIE